MASKNKSNYKKLAVLGVLTLALAVLVQTIKHYQSVTTDAKSVAKNESQSGTPLVTSVIITGEPPNQVYKVDMTFPYSYSTKNLLLRFYRQGGTTQTREYALNLDCDVSRICTATFNIQRQAFFEESYSIYDTEYNTTIQFELSEQAKGLFVAANLNGKWTGHSLFSVDYPSPDGVVDIAIGETITYQVKVVSAAAVTYNPELFNWHAGESVFATLKFNFSYQGELSPPSPYAFTTYVWNLSVTNMRLSGLRDVNFYTVYDIPDVTSSFPYGLIQFRGI
jgi:hypothetical protein